jgi:acyl-CoA synthetase (AMP-forming)/AMP-acid ligase II
VPGVVIVYGAPRDGGIAYERAIAEASTAPPPRTFGPNDPAAIFYTSGTTGFPKGAVMSHLVILSRFGSWGWRYGITEDEVTFVPGPIFHQSFGSISLLTLAMGGKLILRRDFSPERALEDFRVHGVTWSFLVPTMLGALVKAVNALGRTPDLPRLRGLMSSGSRLQLEMIEGFESAFPRAAWPTPTAGPRAAGSPTAVTRTSSAATVPSAAPRSAARSRSSTRPATSCRAAARARSTPATRCLSSATTRTPTRPARCGSAAGRPAATSA